MVTQKLLQLRTYVITWDKQGFH